MKNAISWFEIAVKDFERAKSFYNTMLDTEIKEMPMSGIRYGLFVYDEDNNGVGGGIVEMGGATPSKEGVTIYLNGGDDKHTLITS